MNAVNSEIVGKIGLVKIDYPPVNAAGHAVRDGLMTVIKALEQNEQVDTIAIYCAGRTFVAGADIREFGKPPCSPLLPEVINTIEGLGKPVVACIHGNALGGGLEIALGCHYRIALEKSKLGFPEVSLGILPGAGGTQRTPRLIGLESALEMIVSGTPIDAARGLELGLIDKLAASGDPREIALKYAEEITVAGAPVRRTREIEHSRPPGPETDPIFVKFRSRLEQTSKHLFSPHKCVDAVEASLKLPFEEGLKTERTLFLQCMESPQRQGLIHAFFAQRKAAKVPELSYANPRIVEKVGVVGGGTMGSGITASLLLSGFTVAMIEQDQGDADRGKATVYSILQGAVDRKKLERSEYTDIVSDRFSAVTDFEPVADVDLVIEAVFEDMEVKRRVFEELDKKTSQGTILATNTSYLDINDIALYTSRPDEVLGLHFFSPAHIMKLLEIVVADKTSNEVTATAFSLAKQLGKVPVRAGVCDGFIGNRILAAYRKAADYMMEDGASPYQIDTAMTEFGFAMGPYQTADLAGLDIGWANRKRLAPARPSDERYVDIPDQICERGWFGRKSGRGYYLYDENNRGRPDPEIEHLIDDARSTKGIRPRRFENQEIAERCLAALINEGARVVEEGIALRPLDVDVTQLFGYGFPRWRGGPMKYADMRGIDNILKNIEEYRPEDPYFWRPADLIVKLADSQSCFEDLNN